MPSTPGYSILLRELHRSLPSVVEPVFFEPAKVAFSIIVNINAQRTPCFV
jgi:hypothetical protein